MNDVGAAGRSTAGPSPLNLKGDQLFRCERTSAAHTRALVAVDVWAVPYRTQTGATPPQYNNGPITFALDKAEQTGGGWTGSVNLDSDKISAVSHGYGYFLFCHGTYRGDPPK